jgi:hypothetical protein
MMSILKIPDFEHVLKIGKCRFRVLYIFCLLQEFKFQPKYLGYLTGHRWGAALISGKNRLSSGEELCVLCDRYLLIIRPYLYLLSENTINSGRFIVDTL